MGVKFRGQIPHQRERGEVSWLLNSHCYMAPSCK